MSSKEPGLMPTSDQLAGSSSPSTSRNSQSNKTESSPSPSRRSSSNDTADPGPDKLGRPRSSKSSSSGGSETGGIDGGTLDIADLSVFASSCWQREEITLLQGVNAQVKSGRMLAVMGGSGAGKTTLLKAITQGQRVPGLRCKGTISFNGCKLGQTLFQEVGSYLEQTDSLWSTMTVAETLHFTAGLCMGAMPRRFRKEVIEGLLTSMGIWECSNVIVGDGVLQQGISGGQRRRLSLAVGLIKRPAVLVLDEPTSGLDSECADAIVKLLLEQCEIHNIAVVCTIHQPSFHVYSSFHDQLVLALGRVCYFGPTEGALAHFQALEATPCEADRTPPEFILKVVNSNYRPRPEVERLCQEWREQQEAALQSEFQQLPAGTATSTSGASRTSFRLSLTRSSTSTRRSALSKSRAPWHWQCLLLAVRTLRGHLRNPTALVGRTVFGALAVVFIAFAYSEAAERRQEDVLDRIWMVMWLQQLPAFLVVGTIPSFAEEGLCVHRELRNGLFQPLNYLLADFLVSVPLWFLTVLLSILPGYFVMNMNWGHLGPVWLLITAYVGLSSSVAQLCGAVFQSPALGVVAFTAQTIVNMVFNGTMLARVEQLHWSILWISKLVPSKYSFRTGARLEFEGLEFSGFAHCSNPKMSFEERAGLPCWGRDGEDVIAALSRGMFPVLTTEDTSGEDLLVLLCWGLVVKLLHALKLLHSLRQLKCR